MKRLLPMLAALLFASPALAHDVIVSGLHFVHPRIAEPIRGAMSGAAYVVIANEGSTPDRLLGVETDVAMMAMLHTTEFGADGVARMQEVPPVIIAPGDVFSLEPGGAHIMLMGIDRGLKVGDMVPFTLIFETAGRIEMEFIVDPADPDEPAMGEHMH
jgi:hypothetical protein